MDTAPARIRFRPALAALAAAGMLGACYVVPIDPRTGQPYPLPAQGSTAVAAPVPAAAAAQPGVLGVRLYPLNAQANRGGLLTAVVVDSHTGRGSFTLAYRGDTLQGEATRVDASYPAFGRLHDEVLGPTRRDFSGRRGIANAWGGQGVNVACEYLITGPAMGTGVCRFSDGAHYQMHFG